MPQEKDPYQINNDLIKSPPTNWKQRLTFLGPGLILSASIVGSGELIATTTLGAQAGFVTFWVIIVSCLVKVAVQIEFAKHTIITGETPMTLFNNLPGWRLKGVNWSVWVIFTGMIIKILQVGGIIGGIALLLNMVMPDIPVAAAGLIIAIFVSMLVYKGYYKFIEKASIWMIFLFTLFAFLSLYFLKYTPYTLTLEQFLSGLKFKLPVEAVAVALGAFGITGVGSDEILFYNYWCIEKGYSSYTGARSEDPRWEQRAKGWIRTMKLDAFMAMIVYTMVTSAFYLLGAAVLHSKGEIPEGFAMLQTLSAIFTESLGKEAYWIFMIGSFFILFSTLFASLAAWVRLFTDIFGKFGWIDFSNMKERKRSWAIASWVFPLLWLLLFLFIKMPVLMVLSGGVVGSFMLLLLAGVTIRIRHRLLPKSFAPVLSYDLFLWISIIAIGILGVYSLFKTFM